MELTFVHVTAARHLGAIAAEGLRRGVYLVHSDQDAIRRYYAETVSDEGDQPVVIDIDPVAINVRELAPDLNGIEEPLTYTLGMSEEAVRDRWEGCGQTWRDCVELIGTCRYMAAIAPQYLSVDGRPLPFSPATVQAQVLDHGFEQQGARTGEPDLSRLDPDTAEQLRESIRIEAGTPEWLRRNANLGEELAVVAAPRRRMRL